MCSERHDMLNAMCGLVWIHRSFVELEKNVCTCACHRLSDWFEYPEALQVIDCLKTSLQLSWYRMSNINIGSFGSATQHPPVCAVNRVPNRWAAHHWHGVQRPQGVNDTESWLFSALINLPSWKLRGVEDPSALISTFWPRQIICFH